MIAFQHVTVTSDSEGRVPYLPLDHRHSGYKITAADLIARIQSPLQKQPEQETLKQTAARISEIGTRFGVDIEELPQIGPAVMLVLENAILSDVIRTAREKIVRNGVPESMEATKDVPERLKDITAHISGIIDGMQAALERAAIVNHLQWARSLSGSQDPKELAQAIARTELSLEDVSDENVGELKYLIIKLEEIRDLLTKR